MIVQQFLINKMVLRKVMLLNKISIFNSYRPSINMWLDFLKHIIK
jgi:hypothetical protein